MSEFLETVMLICFGLSWPVTLLKKLRAKNASSTSLAFMILILVGYAAGITAKVMTTGCNYVFYVYIFNVLMVLANLLTTLYFRAKAGHAKRNARGNAPNALYAK
ncbi:MAG: hypothetical protein IJW51_04205 [Clostridia bacterium]|nr:hypothetical protein [Clostridia bacterium]